MSAASEQITEYLSVGGLFNPEMMNQTQHEAVRDTLIKARDDIQRLERENAALRAELQAQAVVNGKGSEREAKLLAENAKLQGCVDKIGAANDKLFMENLYLGKDKQRLDFLESTTGSGWAMLHLNEKKSLTRKEIDRRMATEAKP